METAALVRWFNKALFVTVIASLWCHLLSGAEYRDKQLFLEINLSTSEQVQVKSSAPVRVSELDGLMSRTLSSSFTISVTNPEALSYYGILTGKENGVNRSADSLAVERQYFAWEAGKVVLRSELLHFLPQSFSTKEAAEAYAAQNSIKASQVMEVHLINSTVRIDDNKGNSFYMETPLKLESKSDLFINSNSLGYQGEFVIKTVKHKLILNQLLALEDYLAGVIQNEIGNNSPQEALKAQAVAARTHAVSLLINNRHKADGYDLCSSTHCQVYKGKHLHNGMIDQALAESRNEILFVGSVVADATYHSSCGGKTDSSSAIWKGKPLEHLNGVTCISEADSLDLSTEAQAREWIDTKLETAGMSSWERGAQSWEKSITPKLLAKNAGLTSLDRIEVLSRSRSGRITSLALVGNSTVKLDNEYKIRQVFGNLLSSFFYLSGSYHTDNGKMIYNTKGTIQIKGKGAGHGVGMCQVGALRMARKGFSFDEILFHYYPGTTLNKDWIDE